MSTQNPTPKAAKNSYDPATLEARIQARWAEAGAGTPHEQTAKPGARGSEPFAILMPPPNITGSLHLGHLLFLSLEDAMIRHARLSGLDATWLPGTDHASIGASYMLERTLAAEGTSAQALGREGYLARMRDFAATNQERIRGQIRGFGALADWSRETFTLGPRYTKASRAAFSILYERGLLERRETQITYCPHCATGLSDLELEMRDGGSSICGRCGTMTECRTGRGWFARMAPLAQALIAKLDAGALKIIPASAEATLRHWLDNITDWNLSRQLWWGQAIPAWTCRAGHISTPQAPDYGDPEACAICADSEISPDPDTLDTWFSSGLSPFAALGWPDITGASGADYRRFYPTATLETGHDILFFWCARMLMLGLALTGELPFKTLYLHGLLRDESGKKMAKTAGNGQDPSTLLSSYGADALRWALIEGHAPGLDARWQPDKLEASRRLGNKLWQAGRFLTLRGIISGAAQSEAFDPQALSAPESELLSRHAQAARQIRALMDAHRLHEAASALREAFWHLFCDQHLELIKGLGPAATNEPATPLGASYAALRASWRGYLALFAPFWPHLTEELWSQIDGGASGLLIEAGYGL